ncbi:MAG: SH3 domain-containing protein, partial [Methylotenera sp.]
PIVGSLDNSTEPGEEKPVEIIGFKLHPQAGKWIEIRKATDLTGKVLFAGDGWIPFERVIAQAWSPDKKVVPLYSQPKLSSKKVRTIPAQTSLTIIGFDCFGLKVRYKGQSGWLSADNIKN